jgi:hypothetical protein
MAKQRRVPTKYQIWIDARKRHKLTHAQIQMARELGMNPKSFGKLDNHRQEQWKLPLGQFIEKCYLKRFGKLPDDVLSIEQRIKLEKKKAARREAKRLRREFEASGDSGQIADHSETA